MHCDCRCSTFSVKFFLSSEMGFCVFRWLLGVLCSQKGVLLTQITPEPYTEHDSWTLDTKVNQSRMLRTTLNHLILKWTRTVRWTRLWATNLLLRAPKVQHINPFQNYSTLFDYFPIKLNPSPLIHSNHTNPYTIYLISNKIAELKL